VQFREVKNKNLFYHNNFNPASDASIVLMSLTFFISLCLIINIIPSDYYHILVSI
jgi:hypothetical protein